MKVLVVGGAGFIGSHLVDKLISRGYSVCVLDDLSTGLRGNIHPGAHFVKGSVLDYKLTYSLFKKLGFTYVFNLAAWPRVQRSVDDPIGTHRVNVEGMINLMCIAQDFPIARLVYSCSSSVYGRRDNHVMKEGMATEPVSPYGLQKLHAEQYGIMLSKLYGVPFVSLRYFNVYGPRQLMDGDYALVIGKFIKAKSEGRELTIYGDGRQTRAYTYVEDVARANLLAMNADIDLQDVFNIGTGDETSVNELAEIVGGKVKYIVPNPRGDVEENRKCADFSKAKKLLGWEPIVKVKDGIHECIEDFENKK